MEIIEIKQVYHALADFLQMAAYTKYKMARLFKFALLCLVVISIITIIGCTPKENTDPKAPSVVIFDEQYDYSVESKYYSRPAVINHIKWFDALKATTEDGTFICLTENTTQADNFINTQRTLLHFLKDCGMDLRNLRYIVSDYEDSFSDSGKDTAYIAFSSTKTYRQVLATLHTLWGDYTDYGYVYAMANIIAEQLGWQTDSKIDIEAAVMNEFFSSNPKAIDLQYPCFSLEFASEETVNQCKALSVHLFDDIKWVTALEKPIDIQLDEYYELVEAYAREVGISFARQTCGYAYRGEYLPLCINTTYAQLIVDRNYSDYSSVIYGDYFSDYASIYQTANIINNEITEAIELFGLEDRAGSISINWLSEESAKTQFGKPLVNHYESSMKKVNVTMIQGYLHEYYHHIEHLINPNLGRCWQSQAFCEIGRSHSWHSLYSIEKTMTQDEQWAALFYSFTGRSYQPGVDDYFEFYDILCYATNEYELDYYNGRNAVNSFTHYLIDLYGEDAISNLMLFPETVCDVTGKDWSELESEWITYLKSKFKGMEIPEWISSP